MRLATAPVTWGVDFAGADGNPPWELVFDEISASGLGAVELGPIGYLPEEPAALRHALESRGLTCVGSFLFEPLHDPDRLASILAAGHRACQAIAAAGGSVFVIIDRPDAERAATAGRRDAARALPEPLWASMLGAMDALAQVARRHGLRAAVHPHAGTYLEFQGEIERFLDDSDLDLCLDTGHCAYAGIAPDAAIRAYAPRLAHLHFKDVSADRLAAARASELDLWAAIADDVFCPVGDGCVDWEAVVDGLADVGYDGYATLEQDRVPGRGQPLEELQRSVRVIEEAGGRAARWR